MYSPLDALGVGVNSGIFASRRAWPGLRPTRPARGVAFGSITCYTACAPFLVSSVFLGEILLNLFDGDHGGCDMIHVGWDSFRTRCRLRRCGLFGGSISASAARFRFGLGKDTGGIGKRDGGSRVFTDAGCCLGGFRR